MTDDMKQRIIAAAKRAIERSHEDADCIDRTEVETIVLAGLLKIISDGNGDFRTEEKYKMYDCPISIQDQINGIELMIREERERQIVHAVQKIGIDIDKEGLIEALNHDRKRYEQAYRKGWNDCKKYCEENDDRTIDDAIFGLEWVLEDDKFGFGVNWDGVDKEEAYCDEELAGWHITQAIKLLKEMKSSRDKHCA